MSQAELAERLGVDEQTIKRRESPAGNEPKKGERIAIADICQVPVEFLEIGFGSITKSEIDERIARVEEKLDELLLYIRPQEEPRPAEATEPYSPHLVEQLLQRLASSGVPLPPKPSETPEELRQPPGSSAA